MRSWVSSWFPLVIWAEHALIPGLGNCYEAVLFIYSVAECSLVEVPEDSTPMKTDQGTSMEEEPGQCEGGGEMYMPKATW